MEFLPQGKEHRDAVLALVNSDEGWTLHEEEEGLKIEVKELGPELPEQKCMRAIVNVSCSVFEAVDKLWNPDVRGTWDHTFSMPRTRIVDDSPVCRLTHAFFDVGWMFTSDRDLSLLEYMDLTENKAVVSFASVASPLIPAPTEDYIRGFAYPSGVVAEAVTEGETTFTKVTYVSHLDFRGNLPDVAMTRFFSGIFCEMKVLGTPLQNILPPAAEPEVFEVDESEVVDESADGPIDFTKKPKKEEEEEDAVWGFFGGIAAAVGEAADSVSEGVSGIGDSIGGMVDDVSAGVGGMVDDVSSGVGSMLSSEETPAEGEQGAEAAAATTTAPTVESGSLADQLKDDVPTGAAVTAAAAAAGVGGVALATAAAPAAAPPAPAAKAPPPAPVPKAAPAPAPPAPAPKAATPAPAPAPAPPAPAPKAAAPPPAPVPKAAPAPAPPVPAPKPAAAPPPALKPPPKAPISYDDDDSDDDDDNCVHCKKPITGVKFQLLNDGRSVHDECWDAYESRQ